MQTPLTISRTALLGAGLFSMFANMLLLTGPLFMLQVYDRVLTSQSIPTLLVLGLLVAVLFIFHGVLDFIRIRVMAHIGQLLDNQIAGLAFEHFALSSKTRKRGEMTDPLIDLKQISRFMSGPAAVTLFDLPWLPIYLGVIFLLHPLLGLVGLLGAFLLIVAAVLNEMLSKNKIRGAGEVDLEEASISQFAHRNADMLSAMGMLGNIKERWMERHTQSLMMEGQAGTISSFFRSLSKSLRLAIQSFILGFGAYLAIKQDITPGVMIAVSIIFARAMAPAEQTIAQWRAMTEAHLSWQRLRKIFSEPEAPRHNAGTLPPPTQSLVVKDLYVSAPGERQPLVSGASFTLHAGESIGIMGASGSGKSSLAKALVGAWLPLRGKVRLDSAALDQWPQASLGQYIGYLPQDIELFNGSIAENIARFRSDICFENVLEAGKLSGAHSMILQLPEGYETKIGIGGIQLSAGQRQRVALARAVFGSPFLIVLDEPNSNLDRMGDEALAMALSKLKEAGAITITITHRISIMSQLDHLLVLEAGRTKIFGPRERVLKHLNEMATKRATKKGLKLVN